MKHHSLRRACKVLLTTVLCIFLSSQYAAARKIYITFGADRGRYIDGGSFSYAPGDTLVVRSSSGPISYFSLNNINGTAAQRVVVINEGGQVVVNDHINFSNCNYIKLTGSGSGDQYGFKVEAPTQVGAAIGIVQRSSNIEVERIYINNKKYGFWVKEEGNCDPALQLGSWVIDNIVLHDNKITNMEQEGMYLGSTAPNGERPVVCNGVSTNPRPLRLGNVKVYNNIIDHTNRGAIQLSSASTGISEIYNNTITNVGYEFNYAQGNGIVIGTYTRAYIHHNTVRNTFSAGIFSLGTGTVRIENNTIENSGNLEGRVQTGMSSIMVDTRETIPVEFTTFSVKNNTVGTNTDVVDIRVYATYPTFNSDNSICSNFRATGGAATIHVAGGVQWTDCNTTNRPPTVNAGADQTIVLPLSTVNMSATASDPDGLITVYRWSQVSGPSTATFNNATAVNPVISSLIAGTYVFRLTVTDNSGNSASDDLTVVVKPQPPASAYTSLPGRVEAENYGLMNGIQTESTSDVGGGLNVSYVDYYDWMEYNINPTVAGTYTLSVRVAAANPGGGIEVAKPDGTVLATISVPNTGGWQTWTTVSVPVNLGTGLQAIRLICKGSSSWNLNWLEFSMAGMPTAPATASYTAIPSKVEAENYMAMSGVQKENTADAGGGQNIGYIDQNDWMDYNVNAATAGTYTVAVRVASQQSGAQLQIRNSGGTALATINLPNTGGWQTWQTATATLTLPAGNQTLRVVSTSASSWNINWIDFTSGSNATTDPAPAPAPAPTTTTRVEAENYTAMVGVQKENTADAGGGQNVGYIDNTDWMDYSVNMATAGSYTASFRVASQNTGGQLQLRNSSGTVLATVALPNTGGWQTWQTVTANVTLPAGTQTLRVVSTSTASWNINWFELAPGTSTTTPAPAPAPAPAPSATTRVEAENFTSQSGVQVEATADAGGGQNVGYIDNTDWMDYAVNMSAAGTYTVSVRLAAQMSGGQLQFRNSAGATLATITVPNTGGWQTWQTATASISLPAGAQTLRIVSTASGNWNINWFELAAGASTPPATTAPATVKVEAETYTAMSGVGTETTADAGGGQNVGWIDRNDWMDYSVTAASAGTYTIRFRIASQMNNAQLQVKNAAGAVLATVSLPNTGGWQTWQTVSATVNLQAGTQTIRLTSSSTGSWNINWFELVSTATAVSAQTETPLETTMSSESGNTLSIYPNPVTDRLVVQLDNNLQGALRVDIVSMQGAVVKTFALQKTSTGSQQFYLSVGDLPAGNYIVRTVMAEETQSTHMIKQ